MQLWQSQLNIEYIGRLLPDAAFLQTHFLHQPVVRPKALLSFFIHQRQHQYHLFGDKELHPQKKIF